MKTNNQFIPLTEKEASEINGGGLLDGVLGAVQGVAGNLPIVGPILNGVVNLIKQLTGSISLPV